MYKLYILFLLFILIVILIIIVKLITCNIYEKFFNGSGESISVPNILYHGSPTKIEKLEPKKHPLVKEPVVFGTPSYDDAVIFSSFFTDYDFAMWGDDKHRYIEEQYPGAFQVLHATGYIHHLKGNFRPLGSGLSNEFITSEEVVPCAVDEVNIYDYLIKSNVIMRTYDQMLEARCKANIITIDDAILSKIICSISTADDIGLFKSDNKKQLLSKFTVPTSFKLDGIYSWEIDKIDPNDNTYYIFLGDYVLGNDSFNIPSDKFFIKQNIDNLVKSYAQTQHKTPPTNYRKYIESKRTLYKEYEHLTEKEVIRKVNDLIADVL